MTRDDPGPDSTAEDAAGSERWLTAGVAGVGAASFFSDAGHEITTAVLPSFLTGTLHAGPGALGLIEGASDALIGLSKLAGGPLANDPAVRGRLARGGYLGTAVLGGAIGFATAVWQVALLRAGSWMARGLRSPSRDALLASLAPISAHGRAYGLERAGDNLGALVGPLLAAGLVTLVGIRSTLLLAAIPGMFAAAAITIAARQAGRTVAAPAGRRRLRLNLTELRDAGLLRALAPVVAFECGDIATTLLILRATDLLHADGRALTAATSLAILLYAGHNAVAAPPWLAAHWLTGSGRGRCSRPAPACTYSPMPASLPAPGHGRCCCRHSRWPGPASGWPRRPRRPWSPPRCPTGCAAAGSACSAWSRPAGTSSLPPSSACSGPRSPQRSASGTRPRGWPPASPSP